MKAEHNRKTETSPLVWEDFAYLRTALLKDVAGISNDWKRTQMAKMATGIVMGCYFGLRYSDLSRLTWAEVLQGSVIEIKELKTGKIRSIVVHEFVRAYALQCFEQCVQTQESEPIISTRYGVPFSIAYFNRRLKFILDKYQVTYKNASSHTLRKTFGRRVYNNGGESHNSLLLLMRIFNHQNTWITAKYIGINDEMIKEAYINLDG